jgi:NADH-quinone oxidoreductase subunit C/D
MFSKNLDIQKEQLVKIVKQYFDDKYILLDITAIDYLTYPKKLRPKTNRFGLVYLFRDKDNKNVEKLNIDLEDDDLAVDTISDIYFSANWAEREVYDQYGIKFNNHPNLKRVLNHQEFVGHPLRKDYSITNRQLCTQTQDLVDEMTPLLKSKGYDSLDELMMLNLGPSHPATHGTIRHFLALDGEYIKAAVTEIGYLHRGFEKACENHTYSQIIPYTDRLNYCSAILNNVGYCKAIEDILDIDIPNRAKYIRVILGELARISDHLVCNAANLVDLGGLTSYWYLFNPRDTIYDLFSKLTGARFTNSYTRIGGLSYDLYDGFEYDLNEVIKEIQTAVDDTLSLVAHNKIFLDRTQNVGVIKSDFALNAGITGPNLRATGIASDLRKDNPYYFYDQFDFDVVVGSCGDVYDRMMVRFEEINQSIRIINQAMKNIPKGEINIDNKRVILPSKKDVYNTIEGTINQFKLITEGIKVPNGSYYGATEGANGELGFFVVSDGSGTPYKLKLRPPCLYPLAAYPKIIEGSQVPDAVITMASLNFIAGEFDR